MAKVAQPCSAFQTTNGANIADATARPAKSAGETSQRRSEGVATRARTTPAAKKAAVNFDCSAKPSAKPSAISQRLLTRAPELDQGASPSVQNTTSGASGATNTAPIETSGMAIHMSAASAAFSAEPNRRQAMKAIRAGIAPTTKERKRPHAELRAAEERSRGADEERDHRRMVEIAEGKRARPKRIIGFVESELEPSGGQRLDGQKRDRRRAGIKPEPRGAAEARLSPRGAATGIAAHVAAFALIGAYRAHRGGPSHARALLVNHRPLKMQQWEIGAKVLRGAHSRLAAEVV